MDDNDFVKSKWMGSNSPGEAAACPFVSRKHHTFVDGGKNA